MNWGNKKLFKYCRPDTLALYPLVWNMIIGEQWRFCQYCRWRVSFFQISLKWGSYDLHVINYNLKQVKQIAYETKWWPNPRGNFVKKTCMLPKRRCKIMSQRQTWKGGYFNSTCSHYIRRFMSKLKVDFWVQFPVAADTSQYIAQWNNFRPVRR